MIIKRLQSLKQLETIYGLQLTVSPDVSQLGERKGTIYHIGCAHPGELNTLHVATSGKGKVGQKHDARVIEIMETLVQNKLISKSTNSRVHIGVYGERGMLMNYRVYVERRTGRIKG